MIQIENQASFAAAIRQQANLFVGAGFSVRATSGAGPLPVGPDLGTELRSKFSIDESNTLALPQLHTVINATNAQELQQFLRERFTVSNFDPRYLALTQLGFRSIFTTNIDDLFQCIYRESKTHYINDVYTRGASLSERQAVDLVQLHGSVTDETRPFTFSTLDLAVAATLDTDRWTLLRQRLSECPTLYAGYAFNDTGTLQSLRTDAPGAPTVGEAWVQVRPNSQESGLLDYYRALNFQIVIGETDDLLDYLVATAEVPREQVHVLDSSLENLPSAADVAARPIEDYFLGAAPAWSDIYSGTLARTSHFRTVAERIAQNQNTVLAGIPASGKTTLLMQLAAHAPYSGPRLMFDGLTQPKAALLRRQIGASRALIVLDNVASDIGALEELSTLPNATIVGADRDYTLSSVSQVVTRTGTDILGITSLSRIDLQSIWRSIPERIRHRTLELPETSPGVDLSTFEFIRANVRGKPLDERLIEYAVTMLGEEADYAHMLILACYMHYCRVPLSMDVALAFFRDSISDYRTVYVMMEAAGELLNEYSGQYRDDEQDYFAARSLVVAELVLLGVPSSALRHVLTKTSTEVSPLRIPAFDQFRRRAYDSRLFTRAFSRPDDGAELYDLIYSRNPDAYILQQRALFLADHRKFDDAFRTIDLARSSWRGRRNWSFENSFNKILFRANVDKSDRLPEAAQLAFRAMQGLLEAYTEDARKGQHALVYADCAIRLSQQVRDDETLPSLERAAAMLAEVQRSEPWLERPKFARAEVLRRIRDIT